MGEKETRTIFVIMPFTKTPSREKADLTDFFQINIKEKIESNDSFNHRYVVSRSEDSFNINEKIIKDLFHSDIVICDLSGHYANPNVMFELGIRLSVSDKPVILIREDSENNKSIFDISGYYIEPYNPHRYRKIEEFIIKKISNYEADELQFKSPVIEILGKEPLLLDLLHHRTIVRRLQMLNFSISSFRSKLSGDVFKFLMKNNIEGFPHELDEFGDWFSKEADNIKDLNWSECSLNFIKAPVIEYFLANPDIEKALPSDLRDRFLVYFHSFYDLFINEGNNFEINYNSVRSILWELFILNQLVLSLMSFINGDEKAKKFAYEHFNKTFNMSAIAKYTLDSIGVLTYMPPRNKK